MRRLVRRSHGVLLTRNEGGWTPPEARISIKMKEFGGIGDFEGQRMSKTFPSEVVVRASLAPITEKVLTPLLVYLFRTSLCDCHRCGPSLFPNIWMTVARERVLAVFYLFVFWDI